MIKNHIFAIGMCAVSISAGLALSSASMAAGGDAKAGEDIFKKKCKPCHATVAGKHLNGPSLEGIVGKKAASSTYDKYLGLKNKKDIVWDEANLNAYLADPAKFVGDKTMILKLTKDDERANVIEYLKTLK